MVQRSVAEKLALLGQHDDGASWTRIAAESGVPLRAPTEEQKISTSIVLPLSRMLSLESGMIADRLGHLREEPSRKRRSSYD